MENEMSWWGGTFDLSWVRKCSAAMKSVLLENMSAGKDGINGEYVLVDGVSEFD